VAPAPEGNPVSPDTEIHKHIRGRGLVSSSALGLVDGLVTNLAFLSGFAGGISDLSVIRFAGVAAVLAGAVSMFFGGMLAARSERDLFVADSQREAYEIRHERDEEISELRELYKKKGLSEDEATMVVSRIAEDENKFLEDLLTNELHVHESSLQSPYVLGAVIGLSFLLGAVVPVVPYFLYSAKTLSLYLSVALSLAFLFCAGAWRGRLVQKPMWKSGGETLLIGAVASAVLYAIGSVLGFV
jgi:predicted membrane protein (TIGR00267 family)